MENALRDVRYAFRVLGKAPRFATVAILTLALGVGAITTIFSLVNKVLLEPLPYRQSNRLVRMFGAWDKGQKEGVSPNDFWDYRDQNKVFESTAAATTFTPFYTLTGVAHPVQLVGRKVTSNYLHTLGLKPVAGREFVLEEEKHDAPKVCMLSDGIWRSLFNRNPEIVGKPLTINGLSYTVVGVIPPVFDYLSPVDFWEPMETPNIPPFRGVRLFAMIARLKDGVSLSEAQADLKVIARKLEIAYPKTNKSWRIFAVPLQSEVVANIRPVLLALMGAVIFLLLIVSANLANLMLSWATSRSAEMAVRTALGATHAGLARQVLTLSLVLSLIGSALGTLMAGGAVMVLRNFGSVRIPRLSEISIDLPVLLFVLGISLVIGLIFGLVPVIRIWYLDAGEALKSSTRTSTGHRGPVRSLLVISEVAFSVILLVGAGLLIRTLHRLQHVDLGFKTSNMLTTRIFLPMKTYSDDPKRIGFWRSLVENTSHLPGVENAAIVTELPLSGQDNPTAFTARTRTGESFVLKVRGVSPEYFNMMGIPLKAGRTLTAADLPNTKPVVVLNEAAQSIFGARDPMGEELTFDFGPYTAQVVGVVGNIRHTSLASSPDREAYFPMAQTPLFAYTLVVRTRNNPESVANPVREVVWKLDPDQSVGAFQTMDTLVEEHLSRAKFPALLLALFAGVALLLSSVGLYGVLSYLVSQRTPEIGIRMALGADNSRILRLILRQGAFLTCTGLAIGLIGAFLVVGFISSLLYGVDQKDPFTYLTSITVVAVLSMLASYVPGRSASRLDPLRALRHD
jgi:putative ABC transport system permease protein